MAKKKIDTSAQPEQATATATGTAGIGSFADAIAGIATPAGNKKASTPASLVIEAPATLPIGRFLAFKRMEKTGKAGKETNGAEIIDYSYPIINTNCCNGNNGTHVLRYPAQKIAEICPVCASKWTENIPAGEIKTITVSKFSVPQDPDGLNAIRNILGAGFAEAIKPETTVTLREEVMLNPGLQAELMGLLGGNFAKFFTAETKQAATPDLNDKLPKLVNNDPVKLAQVRELMGQQKLTLK